MTTRNRTFLALAVVAMACFAFTAPATAATIFNGGTAQYNLDGSWTSLQPASGNNGTVNSGIAYTNGDLNMNNYNLSINGGTVAIGRAMTQGLNVTQTAGRWEDTTGSNATGASNGLFLGWDTAASSYTLSGTGAVDVGRLSVGRDAVGTFNQNGGTVSSSTYGGLFLGEAALTGGAGSTYNLAAGTAQVSGLTINAGTAFNFTTGSTGVFYVATSNKDASDIEGLITAADITLGGSSALVSDFVITEVSGGTYDGYTEVKLVPEPATLALLAIGGLGVLLRRRNRKA